MSKISHTQPSQHANITHWTHMKEMKWSSSGFLAGVIAANNLGVTDWLWLNKSVKLLASDSAESAWYVQNQPRRAFISC